MKKEYIKPISKVYQVSIWHNCAVGIPLSSEYDDDSRQAREYKESLETNKNTSHSNIWEEW